MLPPPPPSLRVEATAQETRILLDYGRPAAPVMRWKRIAIAAWVGSMLLSWVFPILFCPLGLAATTGLAAAFVIDMARTVVDQLVLRSDQLDLVHRSSLGRTTSTVPWAALASVQLESQERGPRSRDALMLRWTEEGTDRFSRVGLGRDPRDLQWIRDVLTAVHDHMERVEAGLTETPDDAVIEEIADVVDGEPRGASA